MTSEAEQVQAVTPPGLHSAKIECPARFVDVHMISAGVAVLGVGVLVGVYVGVRLGVAVAVEVVVAATGPKRITSGRNTTGVPFRVVVETEFAGDDKPNPSTARTRRQPAKISG